MSNDEAWQATECYKRGDVELKEICLAHFLGLAYPNTPDSTAQRIAR